jgi:hypothetical protein
MDDTSKITILKRAGPGFVPQEPLALVAQLSDSERSPLDSGSWDEQVDISENSTTSSNTRYRAPMNLSCYFIILTDVRSLLSAVH